VHMREAGLLVPACLDTEVAAFRDRSLAGQAFRYLFLDATYCKARVDRRVVSQAVVVAIGWPRTGTARKLVPSAQSRPRILMRSRSARKSSTPRLPRPPADAEGLCAVGEGYSGRLGSAGYVLAALGCYTRWPLALTDHESSCACPSPTLDC